MRAIGKNIRVQHLVLTQAGQVPTIPSPVTIDPSDDRWKSTDIMKGEWAHNIADDVWFYRRNNNTIATINLNAIGGSGGGLENRYDTVALMIAEQGNQTDKGLQFVSDASGDSTITSGYAYYEYLGTTNGNLTDYRVVTKQEILSGTSIIALIDAEIGTDWKTSGGTPIGAGKRTYSTSTSEPPASGQLRLNNVDPNLATEAYAHDSDGTTDWSGLLNKGDAGSILKVVKDESNYWMFDITGKTDETGYKKYTISPLVIVGTIENEDEGTIELDVSGSVGSVEEEAINTIKADKTYYRHGVNKYEQSGERSVTLDSTGAKPGFFTSEEFITDGEDLILSARPYAVDVGGATGVTKSVDGTVISFSEAGNRYRIVYEYFGTPGWNIIITDFDITFAGQLSTPTIIVTTADSQNVIALSGIDENADSGVLQFYPDSDPGNWQNVPGWAFGTTSLNHTSLTNGVLYRYRFRVSDSTGEYSDSAYALAEGEPVAGDSTAPQPTFDPLDSATDVPVDQIITITFDEPIRNLNGTVITESNVNDLITSFTEGASPVTFDANINETKDVITVIAAGGFGFGGNISLTINNYEDSSGNKETTGVTISFTIVSEPVIIIEDDFTGTTIDTVKHTVVQPGAGMNISQNDELIFNSTGSGSTISYLNSHVKQNVTSSAPLLVFKIDVEMSNQANGNSFGWGFWTGLANTDRISITKGVANDEITITVRIGSTNLYNVANIDFNLGINSSFKIVIDGDTANFYFWDTSGTPAWSLLGTFTLDPGDTGLFQTISWQPFEGYGVISNGNNNTCKFDNLVVSREDFATKNP